MSETVDVSRAQEMVLAAAKAEQKLAYAQMAKVLVDEAHIWLEQHNIFAEQADAAIRNARACHVQVKRLTDKAKELTREL